jgi:hypothetical protein
MQDCMEHCSRFNGEGEGCFGIVWVGDTGACWLRNSNTSSSGLEPQTDRYSALIDRDQMTSLDTTCPHEDLSVHNLTSEPGIQYTTHCGKAISGSDQCWSSYPQPCLDEPFKGFFHTSSLEECVELCVEQHPLCEAVSWSPDMSIGFANCWPKTSKEPLTAPSSSSTFGKAKVMHSVTITNVDLPDDKCPSEPKYVYKSEDLHRKVDFDVRCGQLSTGTNMTSLRAQNVTACMDACAASEEKCVGALFDSSLRGGYRNCYLQNTTSVVTDQASAIYAMVKSRDDGHHGNGSSSESSDGGSKAWIAGPVVGGVVALAVLIGAVIWWRRRKAGKNEMPRELNGRPSIPEADTKQAYSVGPPVEMGADRGVRELPGNTDYSGKAPQELPA